MLKSNKVGRLTVTEIIIKGKGNANTLPEYYCICQCGNYLWVKETDLNRNRITSCGCLKKDNARKNGLLAPLKHGHASHKKT